MVPNHAEIACGWRRSTFRSRWPSGFGVWKCKRAKNL